MPKQTKVCRVCGKTYESCRSIKTGSNVFNWREMCCSPECGRIYFQRVDETRHGPRKSKAKKHTRAEKAEIEIVKPSEDNTSENLCTGEKDAEEIENPGEILESDFGRLAK